MAGVHAPLMPSTISVRPSLPMLLRVPISGGLPGNGAMANMSVDMHQSLELFLVCASYVDDNDKNHQQAYLYRLGKPTDGPNEIPLVEELQSGRPSVEICSD